MRTARNVLLAGVAAVALASTAGFARATEPAVHTMTVQLPGGGSAVIHYTGNVPPQVNLAEEPGAPVVVAPVVFAPSPLAVAAPMPSFGPASPFAVLDHIRADVDRQMAAMLRAAEAIPMPSANQSRMLEAGLGTLPPGAAQYTMVSTMAANGAVCTQTTVITRDGKGQRPQVVSHKSGDCGTAAGPATPTQAPLAVPGTANQKVIQASLGQPS